MAELRQSWQLDGGYTIEVFPAEGVSGQDVYEFWIREGVLGPKEAERRISEVRLVMLDPGRNLVGICTTYLARNEQLRAELWHVRAFITAAHRRRHVGFSMSQIIGEHMTERYVSGADRRGLGLLYEIESPVLKRTRPEAVWRLSRFVFIGEDAQGRHIRVHYFPGALAPEP